MALSPLTPHPSFLGRPGPVVLVILDGVGLGEGDDYDAVHLAHMPNLKGWMASRPWTKLAAHGEAVGLPSDGDMGNSEVGHNALGAGRVFPQGARLVNGAIETGALFDGETWRWVTGPCVEEGKALHLMGLVSDGNVHSHIKHLFALIDHADKIGVKTCRVHGILDGRDVPPRSAIPYFEALEARLQALNDSGDRDYAIASGGGRMAITMDRYEADWPMVKAGYDIHVHGKGRGFPTAIEAIKTLQEETDKDDQNLPGFVIERDGKPIGAMSDGDGVILFNFRGDRAIEISRAFDEGDGFEAFDRGERPKVRFAGMMEYDGDMHVPTRYLVDPPAISETLGEYLTATGVKQFACSETQKFGHVTYFFNGNRSAPFNAALETWLEVPSDKVEFDQRPWMKAAEITDGTLDRLRSSGARFARINYANGDMVGHTGNVTATRVALEAVDLSLGRLVEGIMEMGGIALITADHGNADDMAMRDKSGAPKFNEDGEVSRRSSHSLNPVPFIIVDSDDSGGYGLREMAERPGLANVAATVLNLLGYEAPADYEPSLISFE